MRNNFTFRNQQPDASYAVFTAVAQTKSSRLHSAALRSSPVSSSLHPSHLWRPLELGILKCNIDASYGSDEGSIACISRDSKGRLTDLFSGRVQARSAFEAEVLALTYTLQHLLTQRLHNASLEVESDCLLLIESLQRTRQPPWTLRPLFDEATALLSRFSNLKLLHCRREANLVADWATKARNSDSGHYLMSAHNCILFPPFVLLDLVYADALSSGCNVSYFMYLC